MDLELQNLLLEMNSAQFKFRTIFPTYISTNDRCITDVFNYKDFRMRLVRYMFGKYAGKAKITNEFLEQTFIEAVEQLQFCTNAYKMGDGSKICIAVNCNKRYTDDGIFGRLVKKRTPRKTFIVTNLCSLLF